MAHSIYYLKMQLLSEKFEMTTKEAESVRRMSTFIAVFHSAAFLRSRLCSIAPAQDLKYLSLMKFYLTEDESAAKIAIKSIMLHLWYITEELVIFAIFDKELADEVRENMVRKLLSTNRPLHFEARKPVFPKINPMAIDYPNQLISFIGPRSWLFFNLLKLREEGLDWMQAPITCWNKMNGYNKIEEIVRSMEIVNDCAERGIKLITDFKDVTKNEQQTQYLLQVIEDHRSHTKSLLKKDLCQV